MINFYVLDEKTYIMRAEKIFKKNNFGPISGKVNEGDEIKPTYF